MRLWKSDGTYLTLAFQEFAPEIKVNYELIELSGNNVRSIDRGEATDRYATKLTIFGKRDYIDSIVTELQYLRQYGGEVELDQCQEGIFGDHVDYTGSIFCHLVSLGEQESRSFRTFGISLTLVATDLSYKPAGALPTSMRCLSHGWKGSTRMDTKVNETYNRNNYLVDRESNSFTFEGSYKLTTTDNAAIYNFWRVNRGAPFTINESVLGVSNMFGPLGGSGNQTVVILDISYEQLSSTYRYTTIKLMKV